jgi:glycosyltransferase involved in cell wall biosynthesis
VARFLPTALESVFAQTQRPDEVVVCDDASSDDVEGALAPYLDRVRLVRRDRQGGEGAAKNTALAALTTDFAVVLDGDDAMRPRRLEALHWLAVHRSDLDVLTTDWQVFGDAAAEDWALSEHFPVHDQVAAVLRWNFLPAPALRRDAVLAAGGFDEALRYGPDWELYARMLVRGSRAGLVTEPLYLYRQWSGQQTADRSRVLDGRVAVLDTILRDPLLTRSQRRAVERTRALHRSTRWLERTEGGQAGRGEALQVLRTARTTPRRRALAVLAAASPRSAATVARRFGSG